MADTDAVRQRLVDYIAQIAAVDDGLPDEYEDGYTDGLEYALKLLDGDDG